MSKKIGPSTLEILSNSIAKLQQLGGTVEDDRLQSFVDIVMHHPKILTTEVACDSDKSEPLDMSNTCKQVSSVRDALYELAWSCEAKLEALRAEMRAAARPCGILMLPDDILVHIFEEVSAAATLEVVLHGVPRTMGEILCLVCSRFRSLSLAVPSLWAYFPSSKWFMQEKRVKAHLERSKAVGLTIVVKVLDSTYALRERFWTFLKLVAQHSSRWKILRYEQRDKHPYGQEVSRTIDFLSGLDFSSLEHFDFCVRSRDALDEVDLLGRWNMPKLHHLRLACRHAFPTPKSPFFSSASIRTLELEGKYIYLQDLGNFLASLPNLVDLRLEPYAPWEKLLQGQHIFLPNLTRLAFKISGLKLFSDIVSGLSLSQVQMLRLNVIQDIEVSVDSWVRAIPLDTFATVKDLNLTYEDNYSLSADQSLDLRLIFERFPAIEHLNLKVPRCWCSDIFDMKLPPLRSLALTLSPGRDVEGCLRAAERTGNIESVGVTCDNWETTMQYLSDGGPLVKQDNYDYRGTIRTRTIRWHKE